MGGVIGKSIEKNENEECRKRSPDTVGATDFDIDGFNVRIDYQRRPSMTVNHLMNELSI